MFDTRRFLEEKFGTPDAVVGLASHHDIPMPSKDTVRKWFERGALSSEFYPLLIVLLELDGGEPISIRSYLKKEADNDIFA
ncbi:MAG: hypothetical protein ACOVN5_07070 [Aquidulcibacter sp.]